MKKYLIVLAAALVALAGCKKPEQELTGISFKQAEVVGLIGDTLRLALVATPAEVNLPDDIVWSSSDTDVVQIVDKRGNIALVGSGSANVTAQTGDLKLKAVCRVKACTYEEAWEPITMFYFPSTKSKLPVSDTIFEYEYPSGIYKCQLFSVTVIGVNSIEFTADGAGVGYGAISTSSVQFIVGTPEGKEQFMNEAWEYVGIKVVDDEDVNFTQYGAPRGEIEPELVGPVEQSFLDALAQYYMSEDENAVKPSWYEDGYNDEYINGVYGTYMGYVQSTDTRIWHIYGLCTKYRHLCRLGRSSCRYHYRWLLDSSLQRRRQL